MTYLLHESVYDQPLRATPCLEALERWQAVGLARTAVSIITEAQTLSSLYFRNHERLFHYYRHTLRDRVRVLGIDEPVARLYARLRARCHREGRDLPEADLLVAATAMTHGLTVALAGPEAFPARDWVAWEDWSSPAAAGLPADLLPA
jgi:predicted nucleic acid-binding protein